MCGLQSKLINPDFEKYLNENDFIAVTETKLSNTDLVEVEGYPFFSVNRARAKHASGGVGLFVRNNLCSFVQQVSMTSEFSMMVQIDKKIVWSKYIIVCGVHTSRIITLLFHGYV